MKRWIQHRWMVWCGLFFVCLLWGQGACGPVPGAGGDLPDGPLRFLPDPDGGKGEAVVDSSKEPPITSPENKAAEGEGQRQEPRKEPVTQPEPLIDAADAADQSPDSPGTSEPVPELPAEQGPPLGSWIGGPCRDDRDCDYQDGACLKASDGYPDGTCSLSCTRLCPDKSGQPGTFCLDVQGKIPGGAGGCVSRCNSSKFPATGCRTGYHCAAKTRYNEPQTQADICIPGKPTTPTNTCYQQLAKEGVVFTPRANPKASPAGYPNLLCDVVDAVSVDPNIHGVTWVTGANTASAMFMRCSLALALSKFSKYLKGRGIVKAMHYGTYNCRTIRNDSGSTDKLSQHGLGDAIDLAAFWDTNNKEYNLVKHWDHSTTWKKGGVTGCHSTSFNSTEAKVLYEIGCAMWKQKIFNLVLTPNYNNVHDNHFHVDMSGSGNVLSLLPATIGPHTGH